MLNIFNIVNCLLGFENPDSYIGIYAADPSCYTVFGDLFNPIIHDYHYGFKLSDSQPPTDWGAVDKVGNIDPKGQYVVSTRIRCCRSIEGFPFNPTLTESQYWDIENKMIPILGSLEGELKGAYYPLNGMTKEVQQKLIDDHFLFKEGDKYLVAANGCRYWPIGRGIYHNQNKTFLVWVNEEDQLRIISLQPGGDLGAVYKRFILGVTEIEKKVKFIKSDKFGYLTFCPTNLGK